MQVIIDELGMVERQRRALYNEIIKEEENS